MVRRAQSLVTIGFLVYQEKAGSSFSGGKSVTNKPEQIIL